MKLAQVVETYIAVKRSMGMRFDTDERRLRGFCKLMGDIDANDADEGTVLRFLEGRGRLTVTWHHKFSVLKRFYAFAISRGYIVASPLPPTIPKRPPCFVPYIYSPEEIRNLLVNAPDVCRHGHTKLQADTLRCLLLILWGTGLRLGEAIRLRLSDVDLEAGVLTIHNTKFFKNRIVPMDPKLTPELSSYLAARKRKPCPDGDNSAFLALRDGEPLKFDSTQRKFRKLCERAGVRRTDGANHQPRMHDLRHSFAFHRLVSWYRQGADVQRLLPHLSTYLGHAGLSSTQWYLTITPELLREACLRFACYAGMEVSDG